MENYDLLMARASQLLLQMFVQETNISCDGKMLKNMFSLPGID